MSGGHVKIRLKNGKANLNGYGAYAQRAFAVQFLYHDLLGAAMEDARSGIGIRSNQFGGITHRIATAIPLGANLLVGTADISLQLVVQ